MTPTKRQQDALRFIRGYQLAKGYSPTCVEIVKGLGVKSHSRAFYLVNGLAERGLADKLCNRKRSVLVVDIAVPRAPDGAPLYFVEPCNSRKGNRA